MTQPPLRQGDILLIPINRAQVPGDLTEVPRDQHGRIVLAEGETTGHAHAILEPEATLFRQADLDDMADRYLRIENEAVELVHEEHATITLPPGDYVIRNKREYAPEEIRRVYD